MTFKDYVISVPWRSTGNWRDIRIWLLDNIHTKEYTFSGVDDENPDNRIVHFAHKKDAVLFALRWT
jgi:hypothetical protein